MFRPKVDYVDHLGRALNVGLDYHVGLVRGPIKFKQVDYFFRVGCAAHNQLELRLTQLADQVFPVVAVDVVVNFALHLTFGPLPQTLQVNVLHGPDALARRDERVTAHDVFFFIKADPAHLA